MAQATSPASKARPRVISRALAEARAGRSKNRDAAQQQLRPSHGDPPRSAGTPNTYPGGRP